MASQVWWTSDAFLVFLILYLCESVITFGDASPNLSPLAPNPHGTVEKYFCEHVHLAGGVDLATLNTTFRLNNTRSARTKLNCSEAHLSYKNVTKEEFDGGIHYNGALELHSPPVKYDPKTFCVVKHYTTEALVRIASCRSPVHIKKCCPATQRLEKTVENGREVFNCVEMPANTNGDLLTVIKILMACEFESNLDLWGCAVSCGWNPAIFNNTSEDFSKHRDLNKLANVSTTYGKPQCLEEETQWVTNSKDIWFMALTSGSVEMGLKFWFKPVWLPVEDNDFCLDEFVVDHDPSLRNETKIDSHKIYHKNQILLYCHIAHFDDYLFHRRLFGGMCVAAAGIVFVLLIIYVMIWDKQNLAGWTQFNIFVALFFVVLMEGLRTLFDVNSIQVESTASCVIVAAIAQYFFFALNTTWSVMCFDLFYMFWKLETTSKTVARYINRLILYLLFSWGVPLVVVCIGFYLTHHSAMEEMDEMKGVYAFAHRRCSSPIRKLGFQTQGIMFLLNLIFFALTTLLIWKHRRGLNAAKKRSRNERHTWRSVCLFLKLVVVMGVASLSIPVDYFFVSSAPLSTTAVCFRMIHFIPFVAVLFIFGFNEKNVILISQKYPRAGKYFGLVACTTAGATASETINHSRSGNANRMSDHPSSPT